MTQWIYVAGVWALLGAAVAAADGRIIDSARLFRAADVQSAERSFQELQRRTNVEIVLETVSDLRGIDPNLPARLPPTETDRILTKACNARSEKRHLHGIYILICRDPVVVKYASLRNRIAPDDCKRLVDIMSTSVSAGKTSILLSETADYLREVQPRPAVAAVAKTPPPPTESSGYFWPALFVIGAVVGGGAFYYARAAGSKKRATALPNDHDATATCDEERSLDGRWNIGSLPRD